MESRARGSHWILKKAPRVTAKCNAGSWIDFWISFLFLLSYERCEVQFEVCEIDTMLHQCQLSDFAHHVVWESWHKRVSYLELSLRWIRKSTSIYVYLCIRWHIYMYIYMAEMMEQKQKNVNSWTVDWRGDGVFHHSCNFSVNLNEFKIKSQNHKFKDKLERSTVWQWREARENCQQVSLEIQFVSLYWES